MEFNGVANMKMLLDMHQAYSSEDLRKKLDNQVDLLNRYLVAIDVLLTKEQQAKIPAWHDIRNNKDSYLDNKGE